MPLRLRLFVDAVVAAVALAVTLALLRHGGIVAADAWSGQLDLSAVTLAACSTLPLIAWRRHALSVMAATTAAGILLAGLGYPADVILGPTIALYLLAASRERPAPWTGRTTVIVAVLFVAYLGAAGLGRQGFPGVELLHTGLAWSGAWFAGERTRLRREQIAELQARALRAERDSERERQLAVAQERARIARDLHDSAGHAINVIAVRAGAARLHHQHSPQRSLAAIEAIEQLARQTAEQIDHIVGGLRETPATGSVEIPAGLAFLPTLIGQHSAAGLVVTLDVSGRPPDYGSPADQTVYRILQEALTNAARHGQGSAAIALSFDDRSADLTITNPVPAQQEPRSGGGHGLVGMRERVTLLGGTLHTGTEHGTFRVHARIPIGGQRS
ncbi:two-component sensor histidine kinase [Rhizocola hellebori]|uniref:histidine kinase n=1 Tax=Rhizocola hellebori TaxID=1392758 RepID=A0A8J3Q5E2_9ACTN|nr:two-component sensor histidine kinase [Rhizocola hellebori]